MGLADKEFRVGYVYCKRCALLCLKLITKHPDYNSPKFVRKTERFNSIAKQCIGKAEICRDTLKKQMAAAEATKLQKPPPPPPPSPPLSNSASETPAASLSVSSAFSLLSLDQDTPPDAVTPGLAAVSSHSAPWLPQTGPAAGATPPPYPGTGALPLPPPYPGPGGGVGVPVEPAPSAPVPPVEKLDPAGGGQDTGVDIPAVDVSQHSRGSDSYRFHFFAEDFSQSSIEGTCAGWVGC